MSRRIHVLINGEKFGPYPEIEFQRHVADKKILRSDLVWREGLADWITAEALLQTLATERPPTSGVPASAHSHLEKTRAAAEAGDVEQQFRLGQMLDRGDRAQLNHGEGAKWVCMGAEM